MNPFREKYNHSTATHCYYCDRQYGMDKRLIKQPAVPIFRTVDHIIPKSKGYGKIRNTISCCDDCNGLKGALTLNRFAQKIATLIASKNKGTHSMYHLFPMIKNRAWKLYNKTSAAHKLIPKGSFRP